jgi:replication initiation protein RepC
MYIDLVARIPRSPTIADVASIIDELERRREEILNLLDTQSSSEFNSTNGAHIEQHIQNSKSESLNELEPRSEKEQGEKPSKRREPQTETLKAFPVGGWRDLMSAAIVVRAMLGVSPSAYQEACETMGPENAAVAIACILERAGHINSAGGYLRDLTNRAARGEFSLGLMVMALLRLHGEVEKQSA